MEMIKFVIASAPVVVACKGPRWRDDDSNKPYVRGWGSVDEPGAHTKHEMEDRVAVGHHKDFSAFYVFDGHGGDFASEWLKENMHRIVTDQITKTIFFGWFFPRSMNARLADAFAIADEKLRDAQRKKAEEFGRKNQIILLSTQITPI